MLTGVVLRSRGGVYHVATEEGIQEAILRGRIKARGQPGDRVVVGDRVDVARERVSGTDAWAIERVHERHSALTRRAPGRAPRPKVIVANVDQVVVVFAVAFPEPRLRMLDRFLVLCESNALDAVVVANKIDLVGAAEARRRFGHYEQIGYRVLLTSAEDGRGIEELRELLREKVSAFTGPSGVGKSHLLNRIQPGLGLRVGAVSEAVRKGRHTTVTAELIQLDCGGYVADTPGLRELGLWEVDRSELDLYFPEFEAYRGRCRFGNSCTHSHEPGCAVREAVEAGRVHLARYDSYLRMLRGEEEDGEE